MVHPLVPTSSSFLWSSAYFPLISQGFFKVIFLTSSSSLFSHVVVGWIAHPNRSWAMKTFLRTIIMLYIDFNAGIRFNVGGCKANVNLKKNMQLRNKENICMNRFKLQFSSASSHSSRYLHPRTHPAAKEKHSLKRKIDLIFYFLIFLIISSAVKA